MVLGASGSKLVPKIVTTNLEIERLSKIVETDTENSSLGNFQCK